MHMQISLAIHVRNKSLYVQRTFCSIQFVGDNCSQGCDMFQTWVSLLQIIVQLFYDVSRLVLLQYLLKLASECNRCYIDY